MTGRIEGNDGPPYSDQAGLWLDKFPVDDHNTALADLAGQLGIVQVLDPDFYDPVTGIALDLNTTGRFVSADKCETFVDGGQTYFAPATNSDDGLVSSRVKQESSWTVAGFVRQFASNQTALGGKVLYSCGLANFYFRNRPNSDQFDAIANGAIVATFSFTTVPRILMVSYTATTKRLSIRETTGADLDHELVAATLSADPANGSPWEIGGGEGAIDFAGLLGQTIICNKALHLEENEIARNLVQALMARRYGVRL